MFPRSYQQGYGGFSFQINVLPLCSNYMTVAGQRGQICRSQIFLHVSNGLPKIGGLLDRLQPPG
jgi:hypothetical protein